MTSPLFVSPRRFSSRPLLRRLSLAPRPPTRLRALLALVPAVLPLHSSSSSLTRTSADPFFLRGNHHGRYCPEPHFYWRFQPSPPRGFAGDLGERCWRVCY